MLDLPTLIKARQDFSQRAYGLQRPAAASHLDCAGALRRCAESPNDVYCWVDVVMAAIEGGLRSGSTPFALAQAITNRAREDAARKLPNPLAHAGPPAPDRQMPVGSMDQYGPEIAT